MAIKDYANKTNKKRRQVGKSSRYSNIVKANRGTKKPGLLSNSLFLMVALVAVLFGGAVIYLEYFKDATQNIMASINHSTSQHANKKTTRAVQSTQIAKNEKKVPKFEFYHTLPKMGVGNYKIAQSSSQTPTSIISQLDQTNQLVKDKGKDKDKVNKTDSGTYFLQIASFKNLKDAEALRAKLILAGFAVSIQTAKLPSGEVWHRVKSSKVDNIELAINLHSQLKVHQIESIILADKG
ncbi:MAG: SPOR domain-containing protein [Gammaproteobacteria bacterium]|nr:SPOR domain-containing protein [Gammaproteobacteria bacterium]